jgi:hypothetical protein
MSFDKQILRPSSLIAHDFPVSTPLIFARSIFPISIFSSFPLPHFLSTTSICRPPLKLNASINFFVCIQGTLKDPELILHIQTPFGFFFPSSNCSSISCNALSVLSKISSLLSLPLPNLREVNRQPIQWLGLSPG